MTTAEFIKILQEADPKGTAHIRMEGGIPLFAERKPGYYDGAYTYIDKDGNYVTSTEGDKVDIHCVDVFSFVEEAMCEFDNLEDIKKKFIFNIGNSKDRIDRVMKEVESAYKSCKELDDEMFEQQLKEAIDKSKKGYRFFQNREVDAVPKEEFNNHVYYTWKFIEPDGRVRANGSTPYETQPILESGQWIKSDNNVILGYYEWIYTPTDQIAKPSLSIEMKDVDDNQVYNHLKDWMDISLKDKTPKWDL